MHLDVEDAVGRMRDHRMRRAEVADARRQRARVDAGERDDPAPLQPVLEALGGAVAGRRGHVGAEDRAHRAGARGRRQVLDVLAVRPDIADVREGEGDDLPGIGRIGQDLLVARERGVEAHFADGASGRPEAAPLDHRAVREHEQGRGFFRAPGRRRCVHQMSPSGRKAGGLESRGAKDHMPRLKTANGQQAGPFRALNICPCKGRTIGKTPGTVNRRQGGRTEKLSSTKTAACILKNRFASGIPRR
jgi:hypothetical protein